MTNIKEKRIINFLEKTIKEADKQLDEAGHNGWYNYSAETSKELAKKVLRMINRK